MWRRFWSFLSILRHNISTERHHLRCGATKKVKNLKKHGSVTGKLTWARFDCFVESFIVGRWELNCLLRVTDRASFANFDKPSKKQTTRGFEVAVALLPKTKHSPPLLSSVSMGCFSAVMSRKVRRKRTTRSLSLRMGATWSSSHSGVSVGGMWRAS